MVICKYFFQGNCRFGDSCKNEHSYNENPSSVLLKKPDIDINVLIKAAAGDMLKGEKGSQWPLSCYGPFQGKPCFPGFEDKSFEEVRLGFIEAQQNGTVEQYKQQLTLLLQETQLKIKSLQHPTPEATNMLKNIYYNYNQNVFNNSNNSVFSNKPTVHTNSIFGNAVQPSTLQQNNQQPPSYPLTQLENKSIFANTQTSFQSSNSIFGNSASQNYGTVPPNQNIFQNTTPSQNLFTAAPTNQSIFGNTPANSSVFGAGNTNQNLFGVSSSQNVYPGATPSQNIFTSSASNQNVFTSSANQNLFTNSSNNQNIFTSSANQQNIFATATTSSNAFTGATTNTSSIFGGSQQSQGFGAKPVFPNQLTAQNPVAVPTNHTQSIFGSAVSSSSNQPNFGSVFNTQTNPTFNSPFVGTDNLPNVNSFQSTNSNSVNLFQQANNSFVQTPIQNSVFNNQNTGQAHSSSIFGNKISQPSITSTKREDDPTVYSKLSDLSSNDVTQFESRCFELGKIPIRAPPLEMC